MKLALIFLAASALAGFANAQTFLLALSKTDQTLSAIDPATLKVLFKAPSGPDPHEVIASADGNTAYISNYGGGAYNTIGVIDLAGQKALPSIDLGALRGPHGLQFAGGKLWFTAEAAKAFGSFDPASQKVDFILGTGQDRTHMLYVTPDLNRIVTSNVSSATMTICEKTTGGGRGPGGPPPPGGRGRGPGPGPGGPGPSPGGPGRGPQTNWEETVVPVGRGAEGFDVSPDGKESHPRTSRESFRASAQGFARIPCQRGSQRVRCLRPELLGAPPQRPGTHSTSSHSVQSISTLLLICRSLPTIFPHRWSTGSLVEPLLPSAARMARKPSRSRRTPMVSRRLSSSSMTRMVSIGMAILARWEWRDGGREEGKGRIYNSFTGSGRIEVDLGGGAVGAEAVEGGPVDPVAFGGIDACG